jgi:hypothetical protein
MHVALRLFGLDLLDLTIETDPPESNEPGDSTANAVGFMRTEVPPLDVTMPDWR